MRFGAETLGNLALHHDRVGVGEQKHPVVLAQVAQSLEALHGDAHKEFIESLVNLTVGHILAAEKRTDAPVELVGVDFARLEGQKVALLAVKTEKFIGILHAELLKALTQRSRSRSIITPPRSNNRFFIIFQIVFQ